MAAVSGMEPDAVLIRADCSVRRGGTGCRTRWAHAALGGRTWNRGRAGALLGGAATGVLVVEIEPRASDAAIGSGRRAEHSGARRVQRGA